VWLQGDLDTAVKYGNESLNLARELNLPREYGHNLRIMGQISWAHGKLAEAGEYFQKSYDVLVEAGDEYESAKARLSQGRLLAAERQWQLAYQACKDCEVVFERLGNLSELADVREFLELSVKNELRAEGN
jgi:tetratricopeptide (TPR) repeat protein